MYLTAHRKGPKDLTSPFDRSHAGILSWKMTNFTPIFWLPMEIRHTRWILNPYKVYIFWKLHVFGTYWVKCQRCSMNIEGVGFFSEHEIWNVTKILKCVVTASHMHVKRPLSQANQIEIYIIRTIFKNKILIWMKQFFCPLLRSSLAFFGKM